MKIGILSDIHVDINYSDKDSVTISIIKYIKDKELDIMIIAGDVASDYKLTLETLNKIERECKIPCLYVPGNHDIWTENYPEKSSWEIYELLKFHSHNLANGSYKIDNDWIVIGDLGWYDFSFGSDKYTFSDFSQMQYEERIWQDSIKAAWGKTNLEMHQYFLEKLKNQLIKYKNRNVIIVTHVLPVLEFTVQPPSPMWEYMNAFLGSKDYGELIFNYPNIKYAISGHVHYRKSKKIKGTEFICNCLGYRTEWQDNNTASIEVDRAMMIIEV